MLDFFAGVPGKLKTLTDRWSASILTDFTTLRDRWTSTRATIIDNLDTRLSSARAGYLDKLNITGNVASSSEVTNMAAENTPLLDVPIASGVSVGYGSMAIGTAPHFTQTGITFGTGTTSTTYVDVLDYSGQGVISFLGIYPSTDAKYCYGQLLIDGVNVTGSVTGDNGQNKIKCLVGAFASDGTYCTGLAFEPIPFKSRIQIQCKADNGGTTIPVLKWYKTA